MLLLYFRNLRDKILVIPLFEDGAYRRAPFFIGVKTEWINFADLYQLWCSLVVFNQCSGIAKVGPETVYGDQYGKEKKQCICGGECACR